jgi:hypothetical protein
MYYDALLYLCKRTGCIVMARVITGTASPLAKKKFENLGSIKMKNKDERKTKNWQVE